MSAPVAALWGDVAFHAQQAAEKVRKAYLVWHDVPFRKTHNLEEFGRQCVAWMRQLAAIADDAGPLTEYAWKFRYPGEPDVPDRAEVEEALATARSVCEAIIGRVPTEARP